MFGGVRATGGQIWARLAVLGALLRQWSGGRGASKFGTFEEPEQGSEQDEAQQEKDDTTVVVQVAAKPGGIDIAGEQRQRDDANAVFQNHHKQASHYEDDFLPESLQVEVRDEDGQDQESDAGTDATAVTSYFNTDARKVEDKTIPKNGDSGPIEEHRGDFRGTTLQEVDGFF